MAGKHVHCFLDLHHLLWSLLSWIAVIGFQIVELVRVHISVCSPWDKEDDAAAPRRSARLAVVRGFQIAQEAKPEASSVFQ